MGVFKGLTVNFRFFLFQACFHKINFFTIEHFYVFYVDAHLQEIYVQLFLMYHLNLSANRCQE